jgi:hypothetical protein
MVTDLDALHKRKRYVTAKLHQEEETEQLKPANIVDQKQMHIAIIMLRRWC